MLIDDVYSISAVLPRPKGWFWPAKKHGNLKRALSVEVPPVPVPHKKKKRITAPERKVIRATRNWHNYDLNQVVLREEFKDLLDQFATKCLEIYYFEIYLNLVAEGLLLSEMKKVNYMQDEKHFMEYFMLTLVMLYHVRPNTFKKCLKDLQALIRVQNKRRKQPTGFREFVDWFINMTNYELKEFVEKIESLHMSLKDCVPNDFKKEHYDIFCKWMSSLHGICSIKYYFHGRARSVLKNTE